MLSLGMDLQLLEIPSLEAQLQSSALSPRWLPGLCSAQGCDWGDTVTHKPPKLAGTR